MDSRLMTLKAKKIGVFLRQARENHGLSIEACAHWLGLTSEDYMAIESGDLLLSLPQIESLAYYLDCSFNSLIEEGASASPQVKPNASTNQDLLGLRDRIIAVALKQHRLGQDQSVESLASAAGISAAELTAYEEELQPIPYLHLESLLTALNVSTNVFFAQTGPLSLQHQPAQGDVTPGTSAPQSPLPDGLTEELLAFISKPVNRPYLELAMRLSHMEADKLRAIASSLLEITY